MNAGISALKGTRGVLSRVMVNKLVYAVAAFVFGLFLIAGCLSLSLNSLEAFSRPLFGALSLVLHWLLVYSRFVRGNPWDGKIIILLGLSLCYFILLFFIPEYIWGLQIDGILHRSLLTAIVLIGVTLPAFSLSLYHLFGATPSAKQLSRYPLFVLPVLITLIIYGVLVVQIFTKGVPNLDWNILTSFFHYEGVTKVPGLANYILGTVTLIVLTSLISLPIGIGSGVFIAEYGGRLSGFVRLCTTALRSISVFILGLGAFTLVNYSHGTVFQTVFDGFANVQHGSFLVASIFLSLLVIPVISRVTEEGCNSLPHTLREGSAALGASEGYTLRRVILPWALPNIMTGLLLGCAEAAGSVGVILLIGGYGEFGVGPLGEVTSLSLFIFKCKYGLVSFTKVMSSYQFTAGLLLLLMTMVLSAATIFMQRRFAGRYRTV
jgi:phosphate transport system permease protein